MTDLTNCDIEPIHIPGQIQSHGFLIAIDPELYIRYHSENTGSFLGDVPRPLLGTHIDSIKHLIGENEPPDFLHQLISLGKVNGFDQMNPFPTVIQGESFYLVICRSGDYFVLEFEPAVSDNGLDIQKAIGSSISEMLADKRLQHLLNNSANQIKKVIQYDRVMIYRFAEDGHGEVVAEAKNDNLDPWLGLHYPATDIPKQARELYKINLTRLIANVNAVPSGILSTGSASQTPLDLTYSQLRAVSPVHIQYLKNMEVQSSFSISLLYKNELWGLVACHNYTPRFIDFKARESAKLIGQILCSALEFRQDEENMQHAEAYKTCVNILSKNMFKTGSIEDALVGQDTSLLNVVDCSGAVLTFENSVYKLGNTPDDEQLDGLIAWIKNNVSEQIYYRENLSQVYPSAERFKHIASGIMVSTLSAELDEYIIWFKPEQLHTIQWAGVPEKTNTVDENGLMQISPRRSFEVWSETVAGTSKKWSNEEIKSVMRLRSEVVSAINQKASQIRILNEKLKQAYEELDTFSYTISHDLKNPLSTVKSFSQLILRDQNISPKTSEFAKRIESGANRMHLMINEVLDYSRIGRSLPDFTEVQPGPLIEELITDLSIAFNTEKLKVQIGDTPPVKGDPMMISQVFANLLSNAIKYSMKSEIPEVSIEGQEEEHEVVYSIRDNGIGIDVKQLPSVFDLFKRLDNVQDIEGSGVGLAIVKRIVDKHQGKIWVDSELGKGSTFFVAFRK